ncbi:MAG: MarR family transcriptional regulator [Actinomycetota bacterium]|nr:MAG: MarR family transcriptional regulator [Actinomycetota bacterium]
MIDDGEQAVDLNQLGNDLRIVVGRIVRRFRLGEHTGDVTLSEMSVLARLDREGPLPASTLSDQERISPQAISVIVGILESRALIARAPDAADARRFLLTVTAAGRRLLVGRRSRNARGVAVALAAEFTPAEQEQLAKALPLLERLADRI